MSRYQKPLLQPDIGDVPLGFVVSEWDVARDVPGAMIACTSNATIANAAYEAAIFARPGREIVLCQGARIMRRGTLSGE